MKIYGDSKSGNCYKIKFLCHLPGIEHEWIHIDILKGESRTADFLSKNPNGQIPLVELEDGNHLAESNAILNYLAAGSELPPDDRYLQAKVLEWQFFEQYSHEVNIAVARYINIYLNMPEERRDEYHSKQAGGYKALDVMEKQLSQAGFLVGNRLTIADISLCAYTHVADEGGFSLENYPAIQQWMTRIQALENYIAMDAPEISA